MRLARAIVALLLLATGCADRALHAAVGKPLRLTPLAVAAPVDAWRRSDGSIFVCVLMDVAGGPFPLGTPPPEFYTVEIAKSDFDERRAIPFEAWRDTAQTYETGIRVPGACSVPVSACSFELELAARPGVVGKPTRLADQELRVRELGRVITTLELRSPEDDSSNLLFLPLVPLAYAGDAALGAVYLAMKAAVFVVFSPVMVVALIEKAVAPEEAEATLPVEAPRPEPSCGVSP